jgi:hypothetical protein
MFPKLEKIMKTLLYSLAVLVMMTNLASAQYPVVSQAWVPMVVNTTQYVPYNYSVTNYYTTMVPVSVPSVQYYQTPLYYPIPVVQNYYYGYRPFCHNWNRPVYNYQYFPYRY